MFSPIIRSTTYLQDLAVFTQVRFNALETPAGSNLGEHYQIL